MEDSSRPQTDSERLVAALLGELPAEIGPAATDAIKKHMLKKAPEVLAELFPGGVPSAEVFGEAVVSAVHPPPPLPPGSAGEDNAPMSGEPRIRAIESKVDRIEIHIDHISRSMERIEKTVSNYKWQLLAAVIALGLSFWATSFTIQQMTVSTFQAAGQQATQPQQPVIVNVIPPSPAASGAR